MAEEIKSRKRGPRRTDEERLAEMEANIKKLKERIANKKIKDFEPICENLGKILIHMSGYDFAALPYDKKKACLREQAFLCVGDLKMQQPPPDPEGSV